MITNNELIRYLSRFDGHLPVEVNLWPNSSDKPHILYKIFCLPSLSEDNKNIHINVHGPIGFLTKGKI